VIDLTAAQPQPSAERAGPLRETIRVEADQRGGVVRHDGHPGVDDRAPVTCVGEARRAPAQQAGHEAFPHGSAIPTRIGELYLGRGPDILQASLAQARRDRWTSTCGGVGKRWANERSTAATRAAHGQVSAHCRRGCVSGTQAATCLHGPRPVSQCWRNRQLGLVVSPQWGRRGDSADDETADITIPSRVEHT
jgi:hypothetical protein